MRIGRSRIGLPAPAPSRRSGDLPSSGGHERQPADTGTGRSYSSAGRLCMNQQQVSFDVIVLGGGMAGMTAAAAATGRGARVALLERADFIGGSAVMSGGLVLTLETPADLARADPGAFPRPGRTAVQS